MSEKPSENAIVAREKPQLHGKKATVTPVTPVTRNQLHGMWPDHVVVVICSQ